MATVFGFSVGATSWGTASPLPTCWRAPCCCRVAGARLGTSPRANVGCSCCCWNLGCCCTCCCWNIGCCCRCCCWNIGCAGWAVLGGKVAWDANALKLAISKLDAAPKELLCPKTEYDANVIVSKTSWWMTSVGLLIYIIKKIVSRYFVYELIIRMYLKYEHLLKNLLPLSDLSKSHYILVSKS